MVRLLNALNATSFIRVCAHDPYWYTGGDWGQDKFDEFLRRLRVPKRFAGAIQFDRADSAELASLLLLRAHSGWCVYDDLFLIPDHGKLIGLVSHHEEIHVYAKSADLFNDFTLRLQGNPPINQLC